MLNQNYILLLCGFIAGCYAGGEGSLTDGDVIQKAAEYCQHLGISPEETPYYLAEVLNEDVVDLSVKLYS